MMALGAGCPGLYDKRCCNSLRNETFQVEVLVTSTWNRYIFLFSSILKDQPGNKNNTVLPLSQKRAICKSQKIVIRFIQSEYLTKGVPLMLQQIATD